MSVYLSPFAGAGWQFFNDNGDPLSGGLIYTYQAGTTTPAASYTSVSGMTANSNPIQLDAVGRLSNEVWLTAGASYKFVLKTSDGSTIGTYDDIAGINDFSALLAQLAASSGSSLIGFIQAGAGAVATNLQVKSRQWISVFDFMTSAQIADVQANTALVDVSAAINAAITAAGQNGLIVYPKGTYKIS